MQLQTFQGRTMAEAYQRVKTSLGNDAVILHTRVFQNKKWLGLKRVEIHEITAGRGVNVVRRSLPKEPAPNPAPNRPQPRPPVQQQQQVARPPTRTYAQQPTAVAPQSTKPRPESQPSLLDRPETGTLIIKTITSEMGQIKQVVNDLVKEVRAKQAPEVPEELFEDYLKLTENLVAKEIAQEITKSLKRQLRPDQLADKSVVREKLAEHLEKYIPVSGPLTRTKTTGPHVIALIGPTGVGKTTTIAKLAANLKLREKRKVGLITIDTFRIAAIDQLKRYADILSATLKVVGTPEDMTAAIAAMQDCDFVLIDTAGRSPKDSLKLIELKQFLEAATPDEVFLVLSTTSCEHSVELAMEKFGEVRVDKLIFTKLDEAAQLGVVLNVLRKVNKGLAYVTNGQDVPDDIEVGHGRRLADLILGNT